MISKDELNNSLEQDNQEEQDKKQELEALAEDVINKLDTASDVLEFADILKALVATKGLIL